MFKKHEISRFFDGNTDKNMIKILWVILFCRECKWGKIIVAKIEQVFYNVRNV